MKHLYFLIAVLALVAIAFFAGRCEREKQPLEKIEQLPAEADRQRVVQLDTTERAKFRKLAAERLTRIEALQRTLTAETGKRKQAEQKAANSAAEYAKNKTLANCHTALVDCQEENETKAYSLAVQERMLSEQDSLIGLQGSEIVRLGSVADTLSEGWRIANVNNADLDKQLQKAKGKRFGVGVQVGYGITGNSLSPYVGAGITYNIIKF